MLVNFKVIAHMASPIAATGIIILDSVISAAKAKELLKDDYYAGSNIYGTKEQIDEWLSNLLDKQYGVYCASIGVGDNREYVGSWCKRWYDKDDYIVNFEGKGKQRLDIGAGHYKNYHMPIVYKSYETITFYVRGDMKEVKRLLENNIYFLGKKSSQGYGQIREWEFEEIEENYSFWKDDKPMRPIPAKECIEYIEKNKFCNMQQHPLIPPYWRQDNIELCLMPEV